MPVTPPAPVGRANGDKSAIYRTLGNPLRRRILAHLQERGEANSTSLAQALGESTGTTSYHLRKLAEQRFVEEIPEKSGGRERWWRALPFHIQAPDPAKMEAAELSAAIEHARARADHDIDLYFRVLTQYAGPEGWAQSSRSGLYMTRDELHAFYQEYLALLWKYGHTAARDAPDGARPVALRFFAVPDDTALNEDSRELRVEEIHPDACQYHAGHDLRSEMLPPGFGLTAHFSVDALPPVLRPVRYLALQREQAAIAQTHGDVAFRLSNDSFPAKASPAQVI